MNRDRWPEIDKLLQSALEREVNKRAAFLDDACAGDEELRNEVESLLAAHERAGGFLSSPALEGSNKRSNNDPLKSLVDQSLGHYKILSLLGQGGMGVVYKARDTHLDRFVAIKVLPRELMADVDRKKRFVQEAKAASALNHPNIITIHDIATDNDRNFIVMEHVEGKSLDQVIPRRGLKLDEVLNYSIQIADALAKAHGSGIIHRDLKPGNVMVGNNGLVKVLDFGLAKLIPPKASKLGKVGAQTESQSGFETETGMILGTASYMSPEQAEGRPVDHRSDIFSFGAMLYEMVTGRRAFQGDSQLATLTAILREEPKPASQIVQGVPFELDRVLQRCLRKDPERRFQSAADLKVVLQELRQELDSGFLRAAEVAEASGTKRISSAVMWAAVALAAVGLGAAAWLWLGRSDRTQSDSALTAVPLTSYPGWESAPTLSPDGSQVAFEWSKTSRFEDADIYIKQIGVEGNPVQLTDNPAPDQTPAWSPDGRTIAFARILPPDWKRIDYIVKPQRGGSERTIAEFDTPGSIEPNIDFHKPVKWCAWTADSKSLVVVGKSAPGASAGLFLVPLETREKRRLTDPPRESTDFNPAVSPNGRTLAFSRGNDSNRADLYLLSLSEEMRPQGEPERLAFDIRLNLFPAWTADGREIVFVSSNTMFNRNLWRISVSNPSQRQRLGYALAWNPAVSRQGNRLAYSTSKVDPNIWRVEVPSSGGKPGAASRILSSTLHDIEPTYSPDGSQIAFMSGRSGSWEIWVAGSDGSNPEKLTSFGEPITNRPRWSPDGQRIVFYSDARGNRDVYVMRKDGSELKRLTMDPSTDTNPGWSADGKWIYFESTRRNEGDGSLSNVWKVPVEGGEAVLVSGVRGSAPVESPDGKFLYYYKGLSVWRVPTSGGTEQHVVESLHQQGSWVAVNDGIYFISKPDEQGVSYIRFKDLPAGSVRTIAPIEHQVWWGLAVSPDRRSILYSQADDYGSDLMLVENFR